MEFILVTRRSIVSKNVFFKDIVCMMANYFFLFKKKILFWMIKKKTENNAENEEKNPFGQQLHDFNMKKS